MREQLLTQLRASGMARAPCRGGGSRGALLSQLSEPVSIAEVCNGVCGP
jgi:hypothetical protein